MRILLPIFRTFTTRRTTVDPQQMKYFNELSKHWWNKDGILKSLHAMNSLRIPLIQKRLSEIGVVNSNSSSLNGLSILDVGCGGGILTEPLSVLGAKVTGLDYNGELLAIAKLRAENKNLKNLEYVQSTVEDYAGQNKEKFDIVVASETIEHVSNQEMFVKHCVECLKPNGSIFFTTNSKSCFSNFCVIILLEDILRILPKGTHKYEMFIDVHDLSSFLTNEGCRTLFTSGMMYNPVANHWFLIESPDLLNYVLHAVKM